MALFYWPSVIVIEYNGVPLPYFLRLTPMSAFLTFHCFLHEPSSAPSKEGCQFMSVRSGSFVFYQILRNPQSLQFIRTVKKELCALI